ncbi:MAG: hypothetical protein WBO36_04355, partial [Saprospiraceae bacterium]
MNSDFRNHQLETVHLPTVETITFSPLALTYKKVLIYSYTIFLVVLIIAYIVVGIFIQELFGYPIGIIALIAGIVLS